MTLLCVETGPLRMSRQRPLFFIVFGFPKELQSDQGSNSMSRVFQQVVYELGIKQMASSAYHPESKAIREHERGLISQ